MKPNTQILEEASTWFIEASEGTLDGPAREAFNRWLRTSPEHVRAYLETAAIWENASLIDKSGRQDAEQLVALAAEGANVVPLERMPESGGRGKPASEKTEAKRWPSRFSLAASLALIAAGVLTWFALTNTSTYRTAAGEQRSIVLADGSTVTLNSSSRVRVDFTSHRRSIELLQGQALFNAARDPARPFMVTSGRTQVVALGTQFDIDRRRRGTIVTVLEGKVAVSSDEEAVALTFAATLSAGEQIVVSGKRARPTRADLATVTAWTQRRLVFSSTPLNEVAEEYNRHHARPLVIRERDLEHVNISGSFSSIDAASLIDFLRAQREIAVRETPAAVEIVAAPP